jgi:hypothetical protein
MIKRISLPASNPCIFIYDYWRSKCDGDRLPIRQDIIPNEIKSILPYISMIDVIDKGRDFRMRLIGSEIQRYIGRNCTDEFLSMDMGFDRRVFEPWFRSIVDEQRALIGTISSDNPDASSIYNREIISLPLMNGTHTEVDIIINVIVQSKHRSKYLPEMKNGSSEIFHK